MVVYWPEKQFPYIIFMTLWDIMTSGEIQFSADIFGSLTWEWWNLLQVFPLRPLIRAKLVGAYLMCWGSCGGQI